MPPRKTILPIGIKRALSPGFTFIEVMVTLIILTSGIAIIFKTFISSLDHMTHLRNRLYATTILDNRIQKLERVLRVYKTIPFDFENMDKVNVGEMNINFNPKMNIAQVEDYKDIFQLDLSLSWKEGQRPIRLTRSSYIMDFNPSSK
jgi:prepilin-type N-terminal cleavage/methylation domain-containing protein